MNRLGTAEFHAALGVDSVDLDFTGADPRREAVEQRPDEHRLPGPGGAGNQDVDRLVKVEQEELAVVRDKTEISEIRYETEKAARRAERCPHIPSINDLGLVDELARAATSRGADYISVRRLF